MNHIYVLEPNRLQDKYKSKIVWAKNEEYARRAGKMNLAKKQLGQPVNVMEDSFYESSENENCKRLVEDKDYEVINESLNDVIKIKVRTNEGDKEFFLTYDHAENFE